MTKDLLESEFSLLIPGLAAFLSIIIWSKIKRTISELQWRNSRLQCIYNEENFILTRADLWAHLM